MNASAAKKISPEDIKRATKKMTSGRAKIIFQRSLYAPLLFRLVFKAVTFLKTLATDGRVLMFNVAFVLSLSMEHLLFGILHETLHCVMRHPARRGTRDPELWNIATDFVINAILVFEEKLPHPSWILLDKKYWKHSDGRNWTAEEVYADLEKEFEKSKQRYKIQCPCIQRDPTGGAGGSGEQEDDQKGKGKGKGEGKGKGKSAGSGQQDGKGSGSGDDQDTGGGSGGDDSEDPTFSDPRGWDAPWDKETDQGWKQAVIQTEQMARMRGDSPGWLSSLVDDLVEPPVPIERIIQHIAGSIASDETTWRNPNRRLISRGLHLPVTVKDKKDVVFVGDTSGSIGDDELKDLFGIMLRAFRSKGINELRAIQCDTRIVDDVRVKKAREFKTHVREVGGKGRGGTAFEPVFEKLREEKADWRISCLVYLTDLEGSFPNFRPKYPVFWITINKNENMIREARKIGKVYYWDRQSNRVEVCR